MTLWISPLNPEATVGATIKNDPCLHSSELVCDFYYRGRIVVHVHFSKEEEVEWFYFPSLNSLRIIKGATWPNSICHDETLKHFATGLYYSSCRSLPDNHPYHHYHRMGTVQAEKQRRAFVQSLSKASYTLLSIRPSSFRSPGKSLRTNFQLSSSRCAFSRITWHGRSITEPRALIPLRVSSLAAPWAQEIGKLFGVNCCFVLISGGEWWFMFPPHWRPLLLLIIITNHRLLRLPIHSLAHNLTVCK